jgi:hypothetical protein
MFYDVMGLRIFSRDLCTTNWYSWWKDYLTTCCKFSSHFIIHFFPNNNFNDPNMKSVSTLSPQIRLRIAQTKIECNPLQNFILSASFDICKFFLNFIFSELWTLVEFLYVINVLHYWTRHISAVIGLSERQSLQALVLLFRGFVILISNPDHRWNAFLCTCIL